jgi:hypothetical protein
MDCILMISNKLGLEFAMSWNRIDVKLDTKRYMSHFLLMLQKILIDTYVRAHKEKMNSISKFRWDGSVSYSHFREIIGSLYFYVYQYLPSRNNTVMSSINKKKIV